MPELAKPDLEQLITELLISLRPNSCRLSECPDLRGPQFQLKTAALGQLIYIVPDSISAEEAAKQIERGQILATKNNYHIVTDGRSSELLHLSLSNTSDWRQPVRAVLNRLLGDQWEMVYVEKCGQRVVELGLLRASQEMEEAAGDGPRDGPRDVWLAPVQRRIVAGCVVKKVKKKIIRKVVRKSSREEPTGNGGEAGGGVGAGQANGERKAASAVPPLQNGLTGHGRTPPDSPKLNGTGSKGEGIVGRIANIFNGMGSSNGASRSGRGRSQSLEEQEIQANRAKTAEKKLKRTESEGGDSTGKELTPEKAEGKAARKSQEKEKLAQNPLGRQDSFSGSFVRIPVQLNGASPSPEREKPTEEEEKPTLQNGLSNGPVNGHTLEQQQNGPISKKVEERKANAKPISVDTNGPCPPPLPAAPLGKALSLSIASNRPISSSTPRPTTEDSPKESPPSPISPPSASAGSDSPSFHSASAECPLAMATASSAASRRWRREDAPSPSTSLIQNVVVPRRGSNGGTQVTAVPGTRLGLPLANLLSPISSCGSVEGQQDLDGADAGDDDDDDEEEESTLMLLTRGEGTSIGRSTLGCEDADELSCSLRDDFSLASISQKAPVEVPRGAGGDGRSPFPTGFTSTAIRNANAVQSRPTAMPMSSTRRVQSPSPPKQQQHAVSMSPAPPMVRGMLGNCRMPVPALQLIISLHSYKEMGELRRVHPHWDELCGQLLNSAHSELLHRAQRLLTDCQRRVHREPRMAQPVQLLTRLHVHGLNPVDGMRAFMDEGVLCFPYGALLDRAFAMLARIEAMIASADMDSNEQREREYDDANIQMDQLGEMARRAALHYRQWVEPEAEKRMGELYRASAQQRLQRLDSFLVESSVSRVEREAEKAKTELGWEMEQLRQQNLQLKKENRELKQLCQRLDQRVDVLERKFKTMARLLQ